MNRRAFLGGVTLALAARGAAAEPPGVVWPRVTNATPGALLLNGHTDTVPDIVGRLGVPASLTIFTEGNHFPALLSVDMLGAFPRFARQTPTYAALDLRNIVIVTLPQPMIVAMIEQRSLTLGNLSLAVDRPSGFYPDIVMGGREPLGALRRLSVVGPQAIVFAKNRGMSLLVRRDLPFEIRTLSDLAAREVRLVVASKSEPGARGQYRLALETLLGRVGADTVLGREVVDFPGRLGIQHRDVPYAVASGIADAGLIFHHLARYYAAAWPQRLRMIEIEGAERFPATIAATVTIDAPRAQAARAFVEFLMKEARTVYPRYGFAEMSAGEFGATLDL